MEDATGALDPEVVDRLRALAQAGNSTLLDRLQTAFARDTPDRLRSLRAAVAGGDADAMAFNLHTLTGSAATLGAIRVVASCQALSHASGAAVGPLLAELERSAADAQAALTRLAETG
ncbi:MAG TPA: Hpt domain-containing protein [Gaiellales bacterium]|jgi:HPt (histidine-containing phosphotransfer) domain-containing protein|nr:Hpt domain-containing protein [Gaiellales bacterium]